LNDSQHGFRARRSCETQLIGAITDFQECLHDRKRIDALFLDFAKVFDNSATNNHKTELMVNSSHGLKIIFLTVLNQ